MDVDWLRFLVASLLLGRAAGIALLWIARPAAGADLPPLTSRRAVIELAAGVFSALWTGWHAPLLLAALIVIVRAAMAISYRLFGGICRASLVWVRISMAAAGIVIARLPIVSLYSAAR